LRLGTRGCIGVAVLVIAGYLGRSETFDIAIGRYAVAYADQAERNDDAFRRAAASGAIQTEATTEPQQLVIM
jgi:hypothetical protein